MRLFVRDHIPLLLLNTAQFVMILFIYWLDGYRDVPTELYSIFISTVLLTCYLLYRYYTYRKFYERLSEPVHSLDESLQSSGIGPLPEALDALLQSQYTRYQQMMNAWEKQRKDHVAFMNQWVHQMKTPLSVIHLIAQKEDDPAMHSIREEADRIEKGLEMVLYASRLESFRHDFQVEAAGLRELAEQVIHENKRLFIRHSLYPVVSIEPDLYVETDAKWLSFVLGQLIVNAIKYTTTRNEKMYVNAVRDGAKIVLEVKDSGVGIPRSDLRRVFEPFFTGENGRHFRESTGMGLYLVHEVCTHLGYRLELQSEVGVGTTVRIEMPSAASYLTSK